MIFQDHPCWILWFLSTFSEASAASRPPAAVAGVAGATSRPAPSTPAPSATLALPSAPATPAPKTGPAEGNAFFWKRCCCETYLVICSICYIVVENGHRHSGFSSLKMFKVVISHSYVKLPEGNFNPGPQPVEFGWYHLRYVGSHFSLLGGNSTQFINQVFLVRGWH